MKKKLTYTISLSSLMAAFSIALDLFSLRTDTSRFTIYALPLLLTGIMFGPLAGALAGLAEGLIIQLITYGLTPTTILWIIAPMCWGLISGLINKLFKNKYSNLKTIINVFITSFIVLFINTISLILDGLIYHYSTAFVYTNLSIRIIVCIIIAILYSSLLIVIIPRLKGINKQDKKTNEFLVLNNKNDEIQLELHIKKKL